MNSVQLGRRIDKILYTRNISKQKFAELINRSRASVHNYLDGSRTMGFDTLIEIADALEISLDELCGRDQYISQPVAPQEETVSINEPSTHYGKIKARIDNETYDVPDEIMVQLRLKKIEDKLDKLINKKD